MHTGKNDNEQFQEGCKEDGKCGEEVIKYCCGAYGKGARDCTTNHGSLRSETGSSRALTKILEDEDVDAQSICTSSAASFGNKVVAGSHWFTEGLP